MEPILLPHSLVTGDRIMSEYESVALERLSRSPLQHMIVQKKTTVANKR